MQQNPPKGQARKFPLRAGETWPLWPNYPAKCNRTTKRAGVEQFQVCVGQRSGSMILSGNLKFVSEAGVAQWEVPSTFAKLIRDYIGFRLRS